MCSLLFDFFSIKTGPREIRPMFMHIILYYTCDIVVTFSESYIINALIRIGKRNWYSLILYIHVTD